MTSEKYTSIESVVTLESEIVCVEHVDSALSAQFIAMSSTYPTSQNALTARQQDIKGLAKNEFTHVRSLITTPQVDNVNMESLCIDISNKINTGMQAFTVELPGEGPIHVNSVVLSGRCNISMSTASREMTRKLNKGKSDMEKSIEGCLGMPVTVTLDRDV